MATTTPRVDWVDYAKGLCMVLIVMMHSTLGVEEAVGEAGWLHPLVEWAKPFRMPDFFLIAGLFLARTIDREWPHYLDKKVVHYLYFYVLWTLIAFAFKGAPLVSEVGVQGAVNTFLLTVVEPFSTLWFIYLLPVLFVVTKLVRRVPWWVVWIVAAVLEILPIHTGWTVIDEFCTRFVFFYTGYLFAPLVFRFAAKAMDHVAITIGALVVWAVFNWILVDQFTVGALEATEWRPPLGVSLIWGLVGCAAVIAFSALLSKVNWMSWLRYIGEHSIVIYLAFFIFMAGARTVLLKVGIIEDVGTLSLVVTLAGVIGPLVLYWVTRRTPLRYLFERPSWAILKYRSRTLAPAE
jgi:uncharacterized membrane protein YcfT